MQQTFADTGSAFEFLQEESKKTFSLASGPLARVVLATVKGGDDIYIGISFHHIVVDLRCKEILGREISEAYNRLSQNSSGAPLIEGKNNYSEFVQWQEQWLSSAAAEKARTYWKKTLQPINRSINLPEDFKRLESDYYQVELNISKQLNQDLSAYCKCKKTDVFVLLLSSYYYLLSQFSNSQDFAVGVPLSNRKPKQFKNSLGCFVNTLPIHVDLEEVTTLSELVKRTRASLLQAHRYQDLPLLEIMRVANKDVRGEGAERQLYNVGYTFEPPMYLTLISSQQDELNAYNYLPSDDAELLESFNAT
ncbi:MAG: hypothetical protein KZQ57_00405 [gamma proteobacterium symbiont of Lucinoma myriamae]|nr:hypothetical protein [gamma proteobacterium symbiont of Lucinoma myriamae]